MNLMKKIVPLSALGASLLMLVLSAIDCLSGSVALFEYLPMQLMAILLLLLSLGVTLLACVTQSLRRPLVLLACLLHTPIGGGLLLLYVFDLVFPDQLPLTLLLPYIMLLVSVASALQAGVTVLCSSIYSAEEEEAEAEEFETDEPSDETEERNDEEPSDLQDASTEEVDDDTVKVWSASTPSDDAPTVRPAPVAIAEEDEDDLAPIPKKKGRKQPSYETANRTAPPVVPTVRATQTQSAQTKTPREKLSETKPSETADSKTAVFTAPSLTTAFDAKSADAKPQNAKKSYTDPFGLLTEETKPETTSSVKSIFGEEQSDRK